MKTKFHDVLVVVTFFTVVQPALSAFAQGALTPPGAPAETMKSLEQIEPRTLISQLPFAITNAGSYYVLSDLTGSASTNGITVTASDVTLDLNGFTLRGAPGAGAGIQVVGARSNLCVHDGTVRDWPTNGIQASTAAQGHFYNLQLINNRGAGLITGNQSLIEKCQSANNGRQGFSTSGNGKVWDCVAIGNDSHGIQVSGASLVTGCTANNNDDGIRLGNDSLVKDCLVSGNTNGIRTATRSSVIDCNINDSVVDGIILPDNGLSLILNNICARNLNGAGIHAGSIAVGTRIEGNNVATNGIGIRVELGGNLIIRNSAFNNGTNYLIVNGNSVGFTNTSATILTNNNPNANFSF